MKQKKGGKNLKSNIMLWLMIAPTLAHFFVFAYLPMSGAVLAFKNYNYIDGVFKSPWNGLQNFKFLFSGGKILKVSWNTLAYNAVFIAVNQSLQVITAIFLTEIGSKWYRKITQSVIFLPYFISWVIVGSFIYNLFNYEYGTVNTLLKELGNAPIDVYTNIGDWKYILVAANACK